MTKSVGPVLFSLACLTPSVLWAQDLGRAPIDTVAEYEALAGQFAPVLRFAPGEQYFPTIPFFTAFDAPAERGGRLSLNLADLERVAPLGGGNRDAQGSWSQLVSLYDQTVENGNVAVPAVFYRVRRLTPRQRDQMWDFLKKDEQAWEREDFGALWPEVVQDSVEFVAVEYYLYYINDNGLEGHPQDIEFVFVFVPLDPEYRDHLSITVGAGHTARTPNNVLVQGRGRGRVDVIVELGGHASAPDLEPYGEFQIGIDVNWHASDVWGTRDLLALTGTGFAGGYRPDMTLSRDGGEVFCPSPQSIEERSRTETLGPPQDCSREYHLLPIDPFRRLDALLEERATGRSEYPQQSEAEVVLGALEEMFEVVGTGSTLSDELLDRLTTWTRGLCCTERGSTNTLDASRHQVWEHDHYKKDPVAIVKPHLYRPSTVAFEKGEFSSWWDLLVWGATFHPASGYRLNEGGYELHAGFVVPAPTWLPTRLPGFLELHAGALLGKEAVLSLSALYDNEYRDFIGWYTRLGYTPSRAKATGEEEDADTTLSGGLSLLIWSWDDPWGPGQLFPVNALRLRAGPRLDLKSWGRIFERADWEFQVSLNR